MRFFFGHVETLGHPFWPHPMEIVTERRVGDHELYCFSKLWMKEGPKVVIEPRPDAIVLWDPMWITEADVGRIQTYIDRWQVPVIGLFGGWFAGFHTLGAFLGTKKAMKLCDAIVTDAAGAAAIRHLGFEGPIQTRQEMLTYGRLQKRGGDDALVLGQFEEEREWKWDVSYIGHRSPQFVAMRPYYLEQLREICDRRGWSLFESSEVIFRDLEDTIAASRVTFNHSLGTQLNCRVYEAFACGSALVTDDHNFDNWEIQAADLAKFYKDADRLEKWLARFLMGGDRMREPYAKAAASWVVSRSPERTWIGNLDACAGLVAKLEWMAA